MKKEIIFFDADGTLWYPKKTKYDRHPVWIYRDKRIKNHHDHLVLTPTTLSTLKKLKREGITTIVLSTHPHPPKIADEIINNKIKHFRLNDLFDEVYATPDKGRNKSKGKWILKILKKKRIPKSKALMVGDSYVWDYKPAMENGIDALLIKSKYETNSNQTKRVIKKLSEILKYISE